MVIYLNQPIKNGGVCLTSRVIIPSFATCEFHQARRHLPYDLDKAVYLEVQSNEEGPVLGGWISHRIHGA